MVWRIRILGARSGVTTALRRSVACRRGGERGAALVEFAFILPLLVMLTFGLFSGGMLMNRRESITHAVREGARYGATVPKDQCAVVASCGGHTWAQLVQSIVVARSDGDLTTACVALVSGSGSGSTPPAAIDASHTTAGGTSGCYVDNSADTGLRVQVTASRPDQLDAVFLSFAVTLTSNATAQYEQ